MYHWGVINGLIPFLWNIFTTHQAVRGQQKWDFSILGRFVSVACSHKMHYSQLLAAKYCCLFYLPNRYDLYGSFSAGQHWFLHSSRRSSSHSHPRMEKSLSKRHEPSSWKIVGMVIVILWRSPKNEFTQISGRNNLVYPIETVNGLKKVLWESLVISSYWTWGWLSI